MKRILISSLATAATLATAQTPNDIDLAISSNRLAEATQMVQALKPKYPDNAVLAYLESRLYLRKGDFQSAREALSRAKSKSDLGFVDATALSSHERAIVAGLQPASSSAPALALPVQSNSAAVSVAALPSTNAGQMFDPSSVQPKSTLPLISTPASSVPKSSASSGLGNAISVDDKKAVKIMGLELFDWIMIAALIGFPLLMWLMKKKKAKTAPTSISMDTKSPETTADKEPGFFARLRSAKPGANSGSKSSAELLDAKPNDFNLDSPKS